MTPITHMTERHDKDGNLISYYNTKCGIIIYKNYKLVLTIDSEHIRAIAKII